MLGTAKRNTEMDQTAASITMFIKANKEDPWTCSKHEQYKKTRCRNMTNIVTPWILISEGKSKVLRVAEWQVASYISSIGGCDVKLNISCSINAASSMVDNERVGFANVSQAASTGKKNAKSIERTSE